MQDVPKVWLNMYVSAVQQVWDFCEPTYLTAQTAVPLCFRTQAYLCVLAQKPYHFSGKEKKKSSALEKHHASLLITNPTLAPGKPEVDNAIQRSVFGKISPPHIVQTLHMKINPQTDWKHVLYINTAQSQTTPAIVWGHWMEASSSELKLDKSTALLE